MDCSPQGSAVHGILQARILEWVAISSSKGSSQRRDQTRDLPHCRQILYPLSHEGSCQVKVKVAPSRLTLCNPMDSSPPDSSDHRILQKEYCLFPVLQWMFPTQGSNPCLPHCRWLLYRLSEPPGKTFQLEEGENGNRPRTGMARPRLAG